MTDPPCRSHATEGYVTRFVLVLLLQVIILLLSHILFTGAIQDGHFQWQANYWGLRCVKFKNHRKRKEQEYFPKFFYWILWELMIHVTWMNKNMELERSSGAWVDHPQLLRQDGASFMVSTTWSLLGWRTAFGERTWDNENKPCCGWWWQEWSQQDQESDFFSPFDTCQTGHWDKFGLPSTR